MPKGLQEPSPGMKDSAQTEFHWHMQTAAEVARAVDVDLGQGLDQDSVRHRLGRFGRNQIAEAPPRPLWRLFAAQFADFMIVVLIAAAVIAGLVGEPGDSIAILVIVSLNAVVGAVQEYRAERAVAALRRMVALGEKTDNPLFKSYALERLEIDDKKVRKEKTIDLQRQPPCGRGSHARPLAGR